MTTEHSRAKSLLISDKEYLAKVQSISYPARLLWGKTSSNTDDLWLPLHIHLTDTAAIAELMWDYWVPDSTKRIISRAIQSAGYTNDENEAMVAAKKLFVALAAAHDIGKATPAFQTKSRFLKNKDIYQALRSANLLTPDKRIPDEVKHALASLGIVERHGWSRSMSVVLGGHHGVPPTRLMVLDTLDSYKSDTGFADPSWVSIQDELLTFALSCINVDKDDKLFKINIDRQAQVVLTGLLITADWLASDEEHFELLPMVLETSKLQPPQQRAADSWNSLAWPAPWKADNATDQSTFFETRFGFAPRPTQESVTNELAQAETPGLVIIEAPMGEGKTEAAFAAAEILAAKYGCGGVFVALPTQATSDGMFPRVIDWLEKQDLPTASSMFLAHGKAQFNQDFLDLPRQSQIGIDAEDGESRAAVYVNDWFNGRKRGLLANFVIGTVDQVLMGGLKQRHLAMRHLALTNKVVIIDECHAYDAYMSSYLFQVLAWLGAYRIPTVVLSATLPADKRLKLMESYLNRSFSKPKTAVAWLGVASEQTPLPDWATTVDYPLVTYSDGDEVLQCKPEQSSRSLDVSFEQIDDATLIPILETLIDGGGCIGIIHNTVARAQETARICQEAFGEKTVALLHSQFIAPDRIAKELELRKQLGPPADNSNRPPLLIVVGTQVFEQSLDIDFDVLFTDICPIDLLIQRIGRMHRHAGRVRPAAMQQAKCFVMGISDDGEIDPGSAAVYGKHLLMNTAILLPQEMTIPDDIPTMINRAYSENVLESRADKLEEYQKAQDEFRQHIEEQKQKALTFQISSPCANDDLVGWLDTRVEDDRSGKRGEATVRDTGDTIEVLLIQQLSNSKTRILPWVEQFGGVEIPLDSIPSPELAKAITRCSVRLPAIFGRPWMIDKVIRELEVNNMELLPESWQESMWLQGELFLILDFELRTKLAGYTLQYDKQSGLLVEKDEKEGYGH